MGDKGWLSQDIFESIKTSLNSRQIHWLNFVPNEDRPAIYQNAKIFVYPSYFEGFGFPPLEAMASGAPVVTSNVSSLPEVVGDSAIMVDPYSPSDISNAMSKLLSDKSLRIFYSQKGTEKAHQFSWQKTAREIIKITQK